MLTSYHLHIPYLTEFLRQLFCRINNPFYSLLCISHHPSVGFTDSSPLWEPACLSVRRGGTKCRSGGSVWAVNDRPFYSLTLRATIGRPYFTYNHRDVEVPSPTFSFLPPLSRLCRQLPSMGAFFGAATNYLICSATISSTLANASSILLASLPPPCAISGLPPPRPPATAVISLIILPQ